MAFQDLRICPVFCTGFCGFWLIFGIVALATSFRALDQGWYALELNWHTQAIGSESVTTPGIRHVGFGNMFVLYPSTLQAMYFVSDRGGTHCTNSVGEQLTIEDCEAVVRGPVKVRSADGLEMDVSVSFLWRFPAHTLHRLYSILGNDLYKDEFVRFARAAIVEACSHFPADTYFYNRSEITDVMLDRLRENYNKPELNLEIQIDSVQLREVDVPSPFAWEIANTQEQMQEVEVATAQREVNLIAMERETMIATEYIRQLEIEAEASATRTRVTNEAEVTALLNYNARQSEANGELLDLFDIAITTGNTTNISSFHRLFELMEIRALEVHQHSRLLINVE